MRVLYSSVCYCTCEIATCLKLYLHVFGALQYLCVAKDVFCLLEDVFCAFARHIFVCIYIVLNCDICTRVYLYFSVYLVFTESGGGESFGSQYVQINHLPFQSRPLSLL